MLSLEWLEGLHYRIDRRESCLQGVLLLLLLNLGLPEKLLLALQALLLSLEIFSLSLQTGLFLLARERNAARRENKNT